MTFKPELSVAQKQARVQFARKRLEEKIENVCYSDEAAFFLGARPNRRLTGAWQKLGSARPIFGTQKGKKVLVWGGITPNGPTQLIIVTDRKYDAAAYQRVLWRGLRGVGRRLFAGAPWVFMQDGAPTHTAQSTNRWLRDNGYTYWKSGKGGFWPPYSPDLNPIENVWAFMKNQVYRAQPKTLRHLIQLIQKCWNSLTPERCRALINSGMKRCQEVIDRDGGPTNH